MPEPVLSNSTCWRWFEPVCHRESALALAGLRSDVSITNKGYRKLTPILPHGVNSVSGSASGFGRGLALGFGLD